MVSIYRVSISRSRTVPKSLFAAVSFCASRGTSRKWRFPTMRPPPRSLRFVAKALLCGRLSRPPPRLALFPTRHNSAAQPISCTTATRGVRSSPPPRRRFHPSDLDHRDLALVVGIVVGEVRQRPAGCSPRAARPRPACALPACAPIALTRASTPPAVILAWLSALSLTNFARALSPAAARPRPRGVRASPPPRCRSPTP